MLILRASVERAGRRRAQGRDDVDMQSLKILARQCPRTGCPEVPAPPTVDRESFTRLWSDVTNWPNAKVPPRPPLSRCVPQFCGIRWFALRPHGVERSATPLYGKF